MLQREGLTRDSKVNPDVLLLLISLADEWEGKITGASRGGPVCCPTTQMLPSSPRQLRLRQKTDASRGFVVSHNREARQAGRQSVSAQEVSREAQSSLSVTVTSE